MGSQRCRLYHWQFVIDRVVRSHDRSLWVTQYIVSIYCVCIRAEPAGNLNCICGLTHLPIGVVILIFLVLLVFINLQIFVSLFLLFFTISIVISNNEPIFSDWFGILSRFFSIRFTLQVRDLTSFKSLFNYSVHRNFVNILFYHTYKFKNN